MQETAHRKTPLQGCLMGIDIGTTSIKGGLFSASGEAIALASVAYPTTRPHPGHVEQNPQDWLDGVWTVVDRLFAHGLSWRDVAAVGACSQVNTHAFVDADGRPLAQAIVWQDTRATDAAAALDAQIDPAQRERWWKSNMTVSASHTLARMEWMSKHRPDVWQRTAMVVSPKDFVLRHLTGRWTADPLSCFDFVDGAGCAIDSLIALVPGAAKRLPPLSPYRAVVGFGTHARLAGSSVLFVTGTMDAFSGLLGAGASMPGEGAYTSGTSEILAQISSAPSGAPGIVSFLPVDGLHVQAGPTQSGGDTLRWLATLLRQTPEAVLKAAESASREPHEQLLFLPHLQGERAPLWDMAARGSFLGMNAGTGMPEFALAALEGVACSARLVFDALQMAAGARCPQLFLGGGGARSDFWSQLRADALGVPLQRVACLDTGVVGAAIMGGVGAGIFDSLAQGVQRLVRVERVFVPDPSMAGRYRRMMRRYVAAYEALKPVYRS
ncbi:FGGY-family carbohydrate kinase [Variovorax sp. ZS18.2.2]|uniref:xylulokinase n=1 Tax=Variovorax sp. ZS18.2.2 TaxID=2971255 RepID=UPI0021506C5D|nr:FGGY-family carbohydrate kinase [Variovorax sp. ZS18.2.2]MCR6480874.1 FGGY-family carbohydrate kinase [Variovorax sp. ZS18.2.2]